MKSVPLLISLTAILCSAAVPQDPPGHPPTKNAQLLAEAQAFEKALLETLKRGDRAALEPMLDDGFIFIHATGYLEARDEYLKNVGGGSLHLQRAELESFDVSWRAFEGNTVVRYERLVLRFKAANAESRLRGINVYVKNPAKGWQWVSGQGTLLPVRPKAAAVAADIYNNYAGVYQVDDGRTFTVTKENGALYGLLTGRLKAELVPTSETTFVLFNENYVVNGGFTEAVFAREASGKASEVIVRVNGQEVWRAKMVK